jgi:predicted dehydrogenase
LIEYPQSETDVPPTRTRVDLRPAVGPLRTGKVRLGVIGAGSFARSVLLPALKKLEQVELRGVATASAPSSHQTATRFGFAFTASDWRQVVEDPDTDAVIVATRHNLHAPIAAAALRAHRSVFLEKPMALSPEGLDDVLQAWRASGGVLQVGFNRRFAPLYRRLKAAFASRNKPLAIVYRVNAGSVAPTSWVVDPVQGGGRLIGEVCHMVDLLVDLTRSSVRSVYAEPIGSEDGSDDVVLTLRFDDGSTGTIVYASGGDRSLMKEHLEVLGGGKAAVLEDFRVLQLHAGGKRTRVGSRFAAQDKGHAAELAAFVDAVRHGNPSLVDPEIAAHVTRVTFAAVESARTGLRVQV